MVRYNYLVPIVAKPCFTFSYLGVSFIDFLKEKTPQSIEITAFLVRLPGLEPGASGLGGSRSIQLSYRRIGFPRPVYRARNYSISFGAALSRGLSGGAFFGKGRCIYRRRVICLEYMDESPVKVNSSIRMKEPCVIHGL